MSNPGVIILTSTKIDNKKILLDDRFQIEDNIGESIHIHFRNMRFDLTIKDYLALADGVEDSLNQLVGDDSFNTSYLSGDFLFDMRMHLPFVASMSIVEKQLDDLMCVVHKSDKQSPYAVKKITGTPIYQYLKFHDEKCLPRVRENVISVSYKKRIEELQASLEEGYAKNGKYLTVLGDEDTIRDGYLRASILRHTKGNITLPVVRVQFKEGYDLYKLGRSSSFSETFKWSMTRANNKFKRWTKKYKSSSPFYRFISNLKGKQ